MSRRSIEIRDRALFVDGERTLLVGAEVHNSSTSTAEAIRRSLPRVADLGAQVVLAPVAWESVEPEEGVFDFGLVDELLRVAGELGLRVIPLWFGSWKNGESSYVPAWIKLDRDRFPRVRFASGATEILTPFAEANADADARAFGALLAHVAQSDPAGRVVLVQVENELGLLGDARDRGPLAETAWNAPVPPGLVDVVRGTTGSPIHAAWRAHGEREAGTWSALFGDDADAEEAFMAWAYARYVDRVAAAGRGHGIPLYTNTWLDTPADSAEVAEGMGAMAGGLRPGDYASGGPVRRVAAIWSAFAPSLAFTAPDIYFGDVDEIAGEYARTNPVLFIPEMRRDVVGVAQLFRAVGAHDAIGVAPFGVDSLTASEEEAALRDAYALLRIAARSLRDHPVAATAGFVLDDEHRTERWTFGELTLTASLDGLAGARRPRPPGYGLAIEESPGRMLVIGRGFTLRCERAGALVRVLSAEEVDLGGDGDDDLRVVCRLNGDETAAGTAIRFPGLPPELPSGFPVPRIEELTGAVRIAYYARPEDS
jgi:hypothetical protein